MKRFMEEFKAFISRGNAMDLAVGVIIGGAFTAIVNALVDNLIKPLIELVTGGGMDTSFLNFTVGGVTFQLGDFIGAVINFLIVAFVIFLLIRSMNGMRKKQEAEQAPAPQPQRECPYCKMDIHIEATRCPYCTEAVVPQQVES